MTLLLGLRRGNMPDETTNMRIIVDNISTTPRNHVCVKDSANNEYYPKTDVASVYQDGESIYNVVPKKFTLSYEGGTYTLTRNVDAKDPGYTREIPSDVNDFSPFVGYFVNTLGDRQFTSDVDVSIVYNVSNDITTPSFSVSGKLKIYNACKFKNASMVLFMVYVESTSPLVYALSPINVTYTENSSIQKDLGLYKIAINKYGTVLQAEPIDVESIGSNLPEATVDTAGLLSAKDKAKLDQLNPSTVTTINESVNKLTTAINANNPNQVIINGATESVSYDTGALVVNGGLGVASDAHIGGIVYASELHLIDGNYTEIEMIPSKNAVEDAILTLAYEGNNVIINGVKTPTAANHAVNKLYVDSTFLKQSDSNFLKLTGGTVTGATAFSNTTKSTSTTTGAVTISGGLGVAGSIYSDKTYGAVWNDYAEYRRCKNPDIKLGQVVVELGDDTVELSNRRLCKAAMLTSDTFGFSIGEPDESVPIAVAGRVLAYPDKDRNTFKPGDMVCSGKNGTVSKMNWFERIFFTHLAIGTVSCVPEYATYGNGIEVKDRIWITVK